MKKDVQKEFKHIVKAIAETKNVKPKKYYKKVRQKITK